MMTMFCTGMRGRRKAEEVVGLTLIVVRAQVGELSARIERINKMPGVQLRSTIFLGLRSAH